jgi:GDP-4-dehydro-6-deoxy-D-mannose reductase
MVDFLRRGPDPPRIFGLGLSDDVDVDVDAYRRVDICDPAAVAAAAGDAMPDYVIHLAGAPPMARAAALWTVNVGGACGLMMGLAAAHVRQTRVVGIGSAAEYGEGARRLTEQSAIAPATAYGWTKAVQTLAMVEFGRRCGLSVSIARTFNLTGPGVPARFVVGRLCEQFAAAAPDDFVQLRTVTTRRDFVDVRDAVRAYWRIATRGRAGRVYNVCSGRATRISTLVALLREITGKDVAVRTASRADGAADPDAMVGSFRRIRRELGWTPEIDLERSLRDTLNALRGRPRSDATADALHTGGTS